MKAVLSMDPELADRVFGPNQRERLKQLFDVEDRCYSAREFRRGDFADTEVLVSGWSAPHLGAEQMAHLPKLKAVFYAAGSLREVVSDAFWERGIPITSSWGANATSPSTCPTTANAWI